MCLFLRPVGRRRLRKLTHNVDGALSVSHGPIVWCQSFHLRLYPRGIYVKSAPSQFGIVSSVSNRMIHVVHLILHLRPAPFEGQQLFPIMYCAGATAWDMYFCCVRLTVAI